MNHTDDIYWAIENPEVGAFRAYLHSIEDFLRTEKQKHISSMDEISDKIKSGEIPPPDNPDQFPLELEYDYYHLAMMDDFANILRKSFFVSLYSFLESRLMRRCRRLERRANSSLSVTDIAGRGISQAMTYLIKVCHINFPLNTSSET